MNLRGGWALVKRSLFSYVSSRGFFWTLALAWMMGPLVYMFVWMTAAGQGMISGYTANDFAVYYMVLILVNQLTFPTSNWTFGDGIRSGSISTWLLRPLPAIYEAVATDMAVKIICVPFILIFTVVITLFMNLNLPLSLETFLTFLLSLALAQVLRFLFTFSISILAFWTDRIDSMLNLVNTFTFLLAGQVAPTGLLPGVLKTAAIYLPFRYMLGFPVEVLVNQCTAEEVSFGLAVQVFWVLVVVAAYRLLWKSGIKSYSAVGG